MCVTFSPQAVLRPVEALEGGAAEAAPLLRGHRLGERAKHARTLHPQGNNHPNSRLHFDCISILNVSPNSCSPPPPTQLDHPEDTQNFEEYEPEEDEVKVRLFSLSRCVVFGCVVRPGSFDGRLVVCCVVVQPVVGRPTRKDFTAKDLPFIGYTYKSFDAVNRMTELPM